MPMKMSATLVIQSHRVPLPCAWLQSCLDSVASWARVRGYDYRFVDDRIFDLLEPELADKLQGQAVIASDLARLRSLQQGLVEGYTCVIWCDADFLIYETIRGRRSILVINKVDLMTQPFIIGFHRGFNG